MYNYAFMLASETTIQTYMQLGIQVKTPQDYVYEIYLSDRLMITKDANEYSPVKLLKASRYNTYYNLIELLLGRPSIKNNDSTIKDGLFILENWLKSFIMNERLKGNHVHFNLGSNNYTIKVDEEKAKHNHCSLSLVNCLIDGHRFLEERGSHFLVTTPLDETYGTTTTKCNCPDFLDHRICDHVLAVKSIIANRKLCREHNVFKTV